MSIPMVNYPNFRPYSNVQPFTVRDGATYLLTLEALKDWIRDSLVPHLNSEISELVGSWDENTQEIIDSMNNLATALIQRVEEAEANLGNAVDDAEAARIAAEAARDLAELYASQAEAIQDQAIANIAGSPDSDTRGVLDGLYASVGNLSLLSTLLNNLSDDMESRFSDVDVDLTSKVNVSEFADEKTRVDSIIKPAFDLDSANIHFGATIGPVGTKTIESIFICEAMNNTWFISAAPPDGFVSDEESYSVYMLDSAGHPRERMTFVDGGHGTMFFVEYTDGIAYLWTSVYNYAVTGSGRFNYVRVPWVNDAVYSFNDIAAYMVPSLSGVYNLTNYDQFNDRVGVRRDNSADDTRTLNVYTLEQIKGNDLSQPLHSVQVPRETQYGVGQGSVYLTETNKWYFLFGDANSSTQGIVSYDADTGEKGDFRNVAHIVRYNAQTGLNHAFFEPEGLTVHHTPQGQPSLIFGMSYGRGGARYNQAYSVDMGFVDNVFDFTNSSYPGDRSTPSKNITWLNGFTEDSSYPVTFWIENGEVNYQGRVTGTFTVGTNRILRPAVGSPNSTRTLVIGKQTSSLSPSPVARVDVAGSNGDLVVYMGADHEATGSIWVSLDGLKVRLADN